MVVVKREFDVEKPLDELADTVEYLCRTYFAKVSVPCKGLSDKNFRLIAEEMNKRKIGVSWKRLTEQERKIAEAYNQEAVDLLIFRAMEVASLFDEGSLLIGVKP